MNLIGDVAGRVARARETLFAAGAIVAFTLFVTWPQCLHMWTVALFVPMLMAMHPRRALAALPGLAAGILVAVILTLPYALPYPKNAEALGPRAVDEVAAYSARPLDYLASPPQNRLGGWTARWSGAERNLFPGALAIVLAAAAVAYRPRRLVIVYAALAVLAIELSFGLNGRIYTWLFDRVDALHGFRSPARFAIIACCAVAILAGFGFHALIRRLSAARAMAPSYPAFDGPADSFLLEL